MFQKKLKYPIIWLICLLRCIKFELNWIGIERKWIELELNWKILNPIWIGIELNWKILNPAWIGIELNWKKWIDPSPECKRGSHLENIYILLSNRKAYCTNPITHHFVTELCTHVHISVTNGALWYVCPMHCGICEMGLWEPFAMRALDHLDEGWRPWEMKEVIEHILSSTHIRSILI